jgi:(2Fe-2S) ferredoxin
MIRVAQAKCLGQCATGVNMMIYPENIWLSGVKTNDVQSLADQYIQ